MHTRAWGGTGLQTARVALQTADSGLWLDQLFVFVFGDEAVGSFGVCVCLFIWRLCLCIPLMFVCSYGVCVYVSLWCLCLRIKMVFVFMYQYGVCVYVSIWYLCLCINKMF